MSSELKLYELNDSELALFNRAHEPTTPKDEVLAIRQKLASRLNCEPSSLRFAAKHPKRYVEGIPNAKLES